MPPRNLRTGKPPEGVAVISELVVVQTLLRTWSVLCRVEGVPISTSCKIWSQNTSPKIRIVTPVLLIEMPPLILAGAPMACGRILSPNCVPYSARPSKVADLPCQGANKKKSDGALPRRAGTAEAEAEQADRRPSWKRRQHGRGRSCQVPARTLQQENPIRSGDQRDQDHQAGTGSRWRARHLAAPASAHSLRQFQNSASSCR